MAIVFMKWLTDRNVLFLTGTIAGDSIIGNLYLFIYLFIYLLLAT